MANSGGGAVVVGVANDGRPSGADVNEILALDPAKITDKISRYTGSVFSDFEVKEVKRGRNMVAVIEIGPASNLLVFSSPGTYALPGQPDRQKTAFAQGTIYFRHGAKSEPANADDVAAFLDRRLDEIRRKWLGDIRRVITAPPGAELAFFERTASDASGEPTEIRLTDDPAAPAFGKLDPDATHPFLTKELIKAVQAGLPAGRRFNSHDAHCVRVVHEIEPSSRPEFIHIPKFGSPQYSRSYVDWLTKKPQEFFDEARVLFYDLRHA